MTAALRDLLARASYDEEHIDELLSAGGPASIRLRPPTPLTRLAQLFLAGEELDIADAAATVPVAELEAAGLLERSPGGVRALVRLHPLRGLVIAADSRVPGSLARDHVVAPGRASETLAALTIRRPAANALDLCCGSGVQALLAARHAERVVATDLNPRALGLGRLSAELSGIDNVEWREGNLFEPLGDELFDLVVANPPFVISPTHDLTFRDGGRRGDELSREVVTGVAERLDEGGFGHVLCEWIDEDAPRRWLEASGCDAVVLRADTLDPVAYAMRWTALDAASPQQAAERAERWLPYYAELGIGEISTGAIVLRRRSGTNWVHHDELVSVRGDAGPQLLRIFEGHDLLASLPERRLAFAEGVTLIQRLRGGGGPDRARLTTEQGAALPGRVPPELVPLLLSLDGQKPLAEAAGSGLDAALPAIRDLVRRGYLAEGGR